jgi:hypothetical protein
MTNEHGHYGINRTFGICDKEHISYPHSYPQGPGSCDANHTRHAVFGLDFLTFLCYTTRIQKLNSEKNQG